MHILVKFCKKFDLIMELPSILAFSSLLSLQLLPLYVCTIVGMVGAGYYLVRLATRSPEVSWSHKSNPGLSHFINPLFYY